MPGPDPGVRRATHSRWRMLSDNLILFRSRFASSRFVDDQAPLPVAVPSPLRNSSPLFRSTSSTATSTSFAFSRPLSSSFSVVCSSSYSGLFGFPHLPLRPLSATKSSRVASPQPSNTLLCRSALARFPSGDDSLRIGNRVSRILCFRINLTSVHPRKPRMGNRQFPIWKGGIFRPGAYSLVPRHFRIAQRRTERCKEIEGLRGGVHGYAAQETPKIDAAKAEKDPFRTETN